MGDQNNSSRQKTFILKIVMTDVGLFGLALVISFASRMHPGVIILGFGLLLSTVGAYLGGPNRFEPKSIRIRHIDLFPSPEVLKEAKLHEVRNSAPFYGFENVLLFAGVIGVVIGLSILFL